MMQVGVAGTLMLEAHSTQWPLFVRHTSTGARVASSQPVMCAGGR
jgi:hypothetical protein